MPPIISIIIPCYNAENYIDTCFQSLLRQTIGFEKLCIIMVDDCSTDHTWDKLLSYEKEYPDNVIVIQNEINTRQGGARDIGVTYCPTPYFAFLDADDWIEDTMYEKLYQKMTDCPCDFVMCQHSRDIQGEVPQIIPAPHIPVGLYDISTEDMRRKVILEAPFGCSAWDKLFSKNYWDQNQLRFPWHLAYEDIPYGCALSLTAKRVCVIEDSLYHYVVNPASTVLAKDRPYHYDMFTASDIAWELICSYPDRHLYDAELKFNYMLHGYYGCMKMLFLRFTKLDYDRYVSLRNTILQRVPDYRQNPYLTTKVTEQYSLLLTLLDTQVTPAQLQQVAEAFRKLAIG